MHKDEVYGEWQKLCEKFEAARDLYVEDLGVINQKFSGIYQRVSNINPTDEEIDKLDFAFKEWETIMCKMRDFVKKHIKKN